MTKTVFDETTFIARMNEGRKPPSNKNKLYIESYNAGYDSAIDKYVQIERDRENPKVR
jgi:hypothetical protein